VFGAVWLQKRLWKVVFFFFFSLSCYLFGLFLFCCCFVGPDKNVFLSAKPLSRSLSSSSKSPQLQSELALKSQSAELVAAASVGDQVGERPAQPVNSSSSAQAKQPKTIAPGGDKKGSLMSMFKKMQCVFSSFFFRSLIMGTFNAVDC